jgi:hypothetical protein
VQSGCVIGKLVTARRVAQRLRSRRYRLQQAGHKGCTSGPLQALRTSVRIGALVGRRLPWE